MDRGITESVTVAESKGKKLKQKIPYSEKIIKQLTYMYLTRTLLSRPAQPF